MQSVDGKPSNIHEVDTNEEDFEDAVEVQPL